MDICFGFDNKYARLPERFHARLNPVHVAKPGLVKLNVALAKQLGLDPAALASVNGVAMLAGNQVPVGAEPVALAYAGHQFGHFVPQLGDGRAVLLGEITGKDGIRRDIQLKGSGRTPFSRGGDGRAALGSVLREYLVSEAMSALGIPTTRSLAAVTTGEVVYREAPLPGAVLTRVAASHIRVGTFQYFAARGDMEAVRLLADHAIARHYPEAEGPARYGTLLAAIAARQAALAARWMQVGFIHGVMNTDNTAISGETIDYGPCAFMDAYDPAQVFSSIDRSGRYAFANQPRIALWNLARLAECLLPLLDADENRAKDLALEALSGFMPRFNADYLGGMRRKIGLEMEQDGDARLIQDLLDLMAGQRADFTQTFRALCDAAAAEDEETSQSALPIPKAAMEDWHRKWRQRLTAEPTARAPRTAMMRATNPAYIPRNHLVEAALDTAVRLADFEAFETLLDVTARPFTERPGLERYTLPPKPEERVLQTFCGT